MTFGFLSKNDADTILIDDTYANVALKQKGQLTNFVKYDPYSPTYFQTINFTGVKYPVLAVSADQNWPCVLASINLSAETASFTVLLNSSTGPTNVPIDYYLFDTIDNLSIPVGGWGMLVNDGSGSPTFHSSYGYLDMVDQFTDTATKTYASGRKYAGIITQLDLTYSVLVSGSDHLLTYLGHGIRCSANEVSLNQVNVQTFGPGQQLQNYSKGGCWSVVDVTGL